MAQEYPRCSNAASSYDLLLKLCSRPRLLRRRIQLSGEVFVTAKARPSELMIVVSVLSIGG